MGRTSRVSITRSSFTCRASGMSPISSRKSVPLSALTKRPRWSAMAPVNEPLVWPKSSLSRSVSGMAPQLIATNGWFGPRAGAVDRAREELLAGAALALDQHARVAGGHALRAREHVLHERGAGHDLLAPGLPRAGAPLVPAVQGEGARDLRQQLVRVVGLGEVAEHAALHRRHRVGDRAVGGEDDHGQARVGRLDLLEERHAVHAAHAQVGEHDVGTGGGDGRQGAWAAVDGDHGVAVRLQPDGEQPEQVRVVVNQQQRGAAFGRHGCGRGPSGGGGRDRQHGGGSRGSFPGW